MRILVTCPPMLKAIEEFRQIFESRSIELVTPNIVQTMTESELIEIVPQVDGWIIGDDPATENVFKAGKNGKLKAAVKWGVGVDNVDFKAAAELSIPISNTPKMFGGEVADVGISYLLGLARETFTIDREVRNGNWIKPPGMTVSGKTVALIGLGDIGQGVAKRLKGFDVNVIAYDPFANQTASAYGVEAVLKFPEKLESADFIILTCALTPSTDRIINKDTIAKMKDGVKIINISRGRLINEQDLVSALESGKISAAGLDVFEVEPLPADSPLRRFSQNIYGTHNGSNTKEAVRRATAKAIDLLFGFLNIS